MATFKTPGVFIEEIQTLAPSVAPVPTSIPGFVGYTEKATFLDGSSASMKPVRITSLLEFEQIFGKAFNEEYAVSIAPGTVPANNGFSISNPSGFSPYILYYQIQMFYANGGGTCYIVSVDTYASAPSITLADLQNGLNKLEQVDEVTLLNIPESVFLTTSGQRQTLYDDMLFQCSKLQDRFAILDVVHNGTNTIFQDAEDFRNNDIGPDNLKYAASYYPSLKTILNYSYKDNEVIIDDNRTAGSPPFDYTYDNPPNNTLETIYTGLVSYVTLSFPSTPPISGSFTINSITLAVGSDIPDTADQTVIINAINNHPNLSAIVVARPGTLSTEVLILGKTDNLILVVGATGDFSFNAVTPGKSNSADKNLYNQIKAKLATTVSLYPSGSMSGVYARVDSDRGVWKAPANVGLRQVSDPDIFITDQEQENLNVDSVSGKSINAIRQFTGRGNLVWGARTLAGNDNEWRYVNVRRLFLFVEESIKKATEFVVFEPNTASTWSRVQSLSEAFLTSLWRDGALAGATTQDAFYVRVGLGSTMTPQDILEGRMNVEIGLAASRPAEFIILRFSHKLQES